MQFLWCVGQLCKQGDAGLAVQWLASQSQEITALSVVFVITVINVIHMIISAELVGG